MEAFVPVPGLADASDPLDARSAVAGDPGNACASGVVGPAGTSARPEPVGPAAVGGSADADSPARVPGPASRDTAGAARRESAAGSAVPTVVASGSVRPRSV